MSNCKFRLPLLAIAACFALANQALAVPTQVDYIDTPQCDPLSIPINVHEIGDMIEFPTDESLDHFDLGVTPILPCPPTNNSLLDEVIVEIRNTSGKEWREVWYVADQETDITNFDGEGNAFGLPLLNETFRIDNDVLDPGGIHHPLIFEGITSDGIWEIGETWRFVLQDYFNLLGLPPDAITSIGVGSASTVPLSGIIDSSGSIIAVTVPEPTTSLLFLSGALLVLGIRVRTSASKRGQI